MTATRPEAVRWGCREVGASGWVWHYHQPPATPRRVLVTGSRDWTDTTIIRAALAAQWGDGTRRVPDRRGPPRRGCWSGRVERHPADWDRDGRGAGFARTADMVAAGVDVCLAFIRDDSRGASHTAGLAEAAGIPTRRHRRQ